MFENRFLRGSRVESQALLFPLLFAFFWFSASSFDIYSCVDLKGTHMEMQYALMTFGIPTKFLPVTSHGAITLAHHHNFLEQKRLQEQGLETCCSLSIPVDGQPNTLPRQQKGGSTTTSTSTTSTTPLPPPPPKVTSYSAQQDIVIPGEFDILLGRGRCFRENPGNVRFNYVIEMHLERYEKMGKIVKQVLAEELVDRLKETGSRFLKKKKSNVDISTTDGEEWEIVTDTVAREKVSHSFRNRRKLRGLSSSSLSLSSSLVFSSTISTSNTNNSASNRNYNNFPPLSSMAFPSLTVSSASTTTTSTAASTAIAAVDTNTSVKIMKHLLLLDQNTYSKDDSEGIGGGGGGGDGDDRSIFHYALNRNSMHFGQSLWGNTTTTTTNTGSGGLSGGFITDHCGGCFSPQQHHHHQKDNASSQKMM
jgi:hypothetical protein